MIQAIEISGFRGIQEGKLEGLTPLTILVGPNGCGKSTILDALYLAAHPTPEEALATIIRRHRGVQYGARWLFWRANISPPPRVHVKGFAGSRQIALFLQPGAFLELAMAHNIVSQVSQERGDFSKDVPAIKLVEPLCSEVQEPLHRLLARTIEQGQRQQVQSLLAEVFPGLQSITLLTEGDSPLVYLEYEQFAVPVALAGDGAHALVHLCLELASQPQGIVLMEEPEVHLYPKAAWKAAQAIWAAVRRDVQVILTTHSLEFIDNLISEAKNEAEQEKLSVHGLYLHQGCLRTHHWSGPEAHFKRFTIEDDLR